MGKEFLNYGKMSQDKKYFTIETLRKKCKKISPKILKINAEWKVDSIEHDK